MKVLVLSTAPDHPTLPRPRLLVESLRAAGVEVTERRAPARRPGASRARSLGSPREILLELRRSAGALARLVAEASRAPRDVDAILVPYGGTLDPLLARALANARSRIPVVVDAFLSLQEAAVEDRRIVREDSARARALGALDRLAVRCADLLLVDTPETADLFVARYGAERRRCLALPVGSDLVFRPFEPGNGRLRVLFAGTGIPFHGVEHILGAFVRLERGERPIELVLVGATVEDRTAAAALRNVRVVPGPVDRDRLGELHARTDAVLGVFGAGAKADRVVPCKVYDALASGRAVVTGASLAAQRLLGSAGGIEFVPRADPSALATALEGLFREPERTRRMGIENRRTFEARFAPRVLGETLREAIASLRPREASAGSHARTVPT